MVNDATRAEMKKILHEIQTGQFAKEFILENRAGAASLHAMRRLGREHTIEKVGERLRGMMPWMPKRNIKGAQAAY